MLVVRGVNVFPSQIESALLGVEGLAPHYVLIVDRARDRLDELEIQIEASDDLHARGESAMKRVAEEATDRVRNALGVSARLTVVAPKSIERSLGKAVRVVDRRAL